MTPHPPHIALIANYAPDRQASMLRFAALLETGLRDKGCRVTRLEPKKVLGGPGPAAKWRGYADKFLLAPARLRRQLQRLSTGGERLIVHLCDHSNAPYLPLAQGQPTLVTCHDVMAIKSGLGLVPQNPTRLSGRLLQNWIYRHLKDAPFVVCVSEKTRHDLQTLTGLPDERLAVIPNALPYPFQLLPPETTDRLLPGKIDWPYFLHVGSDAWYKNRPGVLALYRALLPSHPQARLVFVGPEDAALTREIRQHHLGSRVHFLTGLDNAQLNAIYGRAECLFFPSWEEGFGWPVAEAQASGCPVALTDLPPMNAIGGEAAIRLPPPPLRADQTDKWAGQCAPLILESLANRSALIRNGLANAARFTPGRMAEAYLSIYAQLKNGG
ncbi:glycosyltransferase family 4 protein [Ruficoccus amylovorans]|uniref:Glycosyltransferase family 4 protein n=1 Tax=Ruficoccus amylovorans TaxID=1804625 RepID=A0A842HE76_9BACT|nr:glycosyltransferase family 1 protein [Ruficoccus amylovorans]MBC2594549.1 glycosyltransferase family 4 protein [Ruficoccus amylovorans]